MKEIPNLDGYYATRDGGIVSVRSGSARSIKSRLKDGYPIVTLRVDVPDVGKQRHRFFVHRLVAMAFHGVPKELGLEVRHLNGIRDDSRAENLAWGTRRENAQDAVTHGTLGPGMRARHRKLDDGQVRAIVRRYRVGGCKHQLAGEFGIHPYYVTVLAKGGRWSHLSI